SMVTSIFMLIVAYAEEEFLPFFFFFSSRRRHTRSKRDWSSDVCSSDLRILPFAIFFSFWKVSLFEIVSLGKPNSLRTRLEIRCRSEERRVGKECRFVWSMDHTKEKKEEKRYGARSIVGRTAQV